MLQCSQGGWGALRTSGVLSEVLVYSGGVEVLSEVLGCSHGCCSALRGVGVLS